MSILSKLKPLIKQFKKYDSLDLTCTLSKNGIFYSFKINYSMVFPEVNHYILTITIWKSSRVYCKIHVKSWKGKLQAKIHVRKRKRESIVKVLEKLVKILNI